MSGWWVGGKFFLEYNIVLLGDLGVGKLGEMFYFVIGVVWVFGIFFFGILFIIYFCKWCRNNWFIRSGICKSISDLY